MCTVSYANDLPTELYNNIIIYSIAPRARVSQVVCNNKNASLPHPEGIAKNVTLKCNIVVRRAVKIIGKKKKSNFNYFFLISVHFFNISTNA